IEGDGWIGVDADKELDELPYVDVVWDEEPLDIETIVGEDWVYADQNVGQEGPDVASSVDVAWDADLQLAQGTEEMMKCIKAIEDNKVDSHDSILILASILNGGPVVLDE
ncbi:hypothetical protein ACJX0J_030490, partial [Zea mays]